jgi:hypothetical protein
MDYDRDVGAAQLPLATKLAPSKKDTVSSPPVGGDSTNSPISSTVELHAAFRNALVWEHNPTSFTEQLILDDVARRAAQARHQDDIATALENQISRAIGSAALLAGGEQDAPAAILSALGASQRLEAIRRLSLGQSRAFLHAVRQLTQLQRERRETGRLTGETDERFQTEEQCLAFLMRRFERGELPCPRCRNTSGGCWLATHRAWECGRCKSQIGIRAGTIMQNSGLPLTSWFKAIRLLLSYPLMSTAELSQRLGMKRRSTVRGMAKKIRTAIATNPDILAGLDESLLPELGGRLN